MLQNEGTIRRSGSSPAEPARSDAPGDEWIGRVLGSSYRVDRVLARGGMSAVCAGEQLRLHRPVAIKVILEHLADQAPVLERFRQEAEVISQLGHPHIVHVLDVGEDAGNPYLVMELLEGETLAKRLDRKGHLSVAAAVKIASQVAAALACTHAQGIVHRDLKPENVFLVSALGEPDFVKVLDFGISKVLAGPRVTQELVVLGTPAYMAPEQARGEGDIDHRVDQFALASVVYEMLAGQPAFSGDHHVDVMRRVIDANPPPLGEIAPWVPHEIELVLRRALSRDRDQRFPSISRFAWALENAAASSGLRGGTPVPTSRPHPATTPPDAGVTAELSPAAAEVERARATFESGAIDDAVGHAERVFEIAVWGRDARVHEVLRAALPLLGRIFEARVGPLTGRIAVTPAGRDPVRLNLSPKAAALLGCVDGENDAASVVEASGIPRRDAVRMLAGLLRRGALVRLG